jgi:hypothetical protein
MRDRAGLREIGKSERAAKPRQSRPAVTAFNTRTFDAYRRPGSIRGTAKTRVTARGKFRCLTLVHACPIGSQEGRAGIPLPVSGHCGISVHTDGTNTATRKLCVFQGDHGECWTN